MDTQDDEIDCESDRTCEGIKEDGIKCQNPAITGSRFCFFHDPAKKRERREAQQRGGRANRAAVLPADAPDIPLNSVKDIAALNARIINLQLRGEMSPKEASSLIYSCCQLAKLIEPANTDERLVRLEKTFGARVGESLQSEPLQSDLDQELKTYSDVCSKAKQPSGTE
jgi:hypothetical protein